MAKDRQNTHFPAMSNSITVSKMSDFFVSTAWSCVYLQNVATEFQSSKVNLPKYFETYKNRCFLWLRFIATDRRKGIKKSVATFFRQFPEEENEKK